jgi:hypothetical protein
LIPEGWVVGFFMKGEGMDNILGTGFVVIVLICIIRFVNVANTLGRIDLPWELMQH